MPFADSAGVRIHYEVRGDGPPLVLHHGQCGSGAAWDRFGYVSALAPHYRLILLDARGHGASDKPHDHADYALPSCVGDVVAVLDALDVERAHFLGASMGGRVGFGLVRHAPERVRSLVIVGAHPYRDSSYVRFRHIDPTDPEAFLAALEAAIAEPVPAEARPLVLANDLRATAAAVGDRPSLEDVLPAMTMPCLFVAGEADARHAAVRECAGRIPSARFVSLPGLGHIMSIVRGDLVVPHVQRFLAAIPD